MTDYARLFLDTNRDAGVLVLNGVATDLQRRVYAGPRESHDNQGCGCLKVYADGMASSLLELYATRSFLSRLRMYGLSLGPVGTPPFRFEAVQMGSDAAETGNWGYLKLFARKSGGMGAGQIVRIGTDPENLRGSIRISDPNNSERFIALEIDDSGPFLYMADGDRVTLISPYGIQGEPDKGDWSFVAQHPEEADSEIHYAVLEGPEVGVYARGTATLAAGRAVVALPRHFGYVASAEGLTVQLTPRSGDSKGVAASRLTVHELEVVELLGGTGSYDVDWAVHGIRRGRESFEVVRPRSQRASRSATRPVAGGRDDHESDDGPAG